MDDLNKKVCPLLSDLSAIPQVVIHCTANCGWYVDEWEDEKIIYPGRCSMIYMKALYCQLKNMDRSLDNLQDVSSGLTELSGIIHDK